MKSFRETSKYPRQVQQVKLDFGIFRHLSSFSSLSLFMQPPEQQALGTSSPVGPPDSAVEAQISHVGDSLLKSLARVLSRVPRPSPGPQALADTLDLDKVLASRVLKA